MLLVSCYAYAFAFARGEGAGEAASFSGALRWLDFGSGQERGIRGAARERYFKGRRQAKETAGVGAGDGDDDAYA